MNNVGLRFAKTDLQPSVTISPVGWPERSEAQHKTVSHYLNIHNGPRFAKTDLQFSAINSPVGWPERSEAQRKTVNHYLNIHIVPRFAKTDLRLSVINSPKPDLSAAKPNVYLYNSLTMLLQTGKVTIQRKPKSLT